MSTLLFWNDATLYKFQTDVLYLLLKSYTNTYNISRAAELRLVHQGSTESQCPQSCLVILWCFYSHFKVRQAQRCGLRWESRDLNTADINQGYGAQDRWNWPSEFYQLSGHASSASSASSLSSSGSVNRSIDNLSDNGRLNLSKTRSV